MKQTQFMEKYPVYTFELNKDESKYESVEDIIQFLTLKIIENPIAKYIGEFDHCEHTSSIGGEISDDIKGAKIVLFCFGQKLPKPEMMAVRPRSIGVADMGDRFFITFLEAPMPAINETVEGWIKEIVIHR